MHFKIVVAGNGCVGKTTFLNKYCNDIFIYDYQPTLMDVYEKIIVPKDIDSDLGKSTANVSIGSKQKIKAKSENSQKPIKISFWDMAGQDNYKNYRANYYKNTDLFILVYAVDSLKSFYNIRDKWMPEIRSHPECKDVPLLIIGTKLDTRNYYEYWGDPRVRQCVTKEQTENMRYLEKCKVVECSSYTGENVEKVISTVLEILPTQTKDSQKNCVIC